MIEIRTINNYLKWFIFFIIGVVVSGGINFYLNYESEQEFQIDPEVKLDPEQEYQIVYWDYPLSWGLESSYKEFLEAKIAQFEIEYPNIRVDYKLLSPLEGRTKLKESLVQGSPPDIYNAIFGGGLFDKRLQLPLGLLFSQEELALDRPLALKSFRSEGKIWGLPHGLYPQLWAANENVLRQSSLELAKVYQKGWNWQQFIKWTGEITDLEAEQKIIFHPHQAKLLMQLIAAGRGPKLYDGSGDFNAKRLKDAFTLLAKLRAEEVFPKPAKKMGKKMLARFWQGKAALIGPLTPWLLNSLYEQKKRYRKVELTLLPIPIKGREYRKILVKAAGLILFRQEEYKGDQHSKAVYKFAQFINRAQNLYLREQLNIVTSYLPDYKEDKIIINHKLDRLLLGYIKRGIPYGPFNLKKWRQQKEIESISGEEYSKFWLKNKVPSEILREITTKAPNYHN